MREHEKSQNHSKSCISFQFLWRVFFQDLCFLKAKFLRFSRNHSSLFNFTRNHSNLFFWTALQRFPGNVSPQYSFQPPVLGITPSQHNFVSTCFNTHCVTVRTRHKKIWNNDTYDLNGRFGNPGSPDVSSVHPFSTHFQKHVESAHTLRIFFKRCWHWRWVSILFKGCMMCEFWYFSNLLKR